VATKGVFENLQQERAGGEGTAYKSDNTSQKKSRGTVQPRSWVDLRTSFQGEVTDGVAINEDLQIICIFEFKQSTERDEGFLEVKEAEANEQHKSIIDTLMMMMISFITFNGSLIPLFEGL